MDHVLAWKRLLLSLCGCAFVFAGIVSYHVITFDVTIGLRLRATQRDFIDTTVVRLGSPAFVSGIRTGDQVDLRQLSPAERYRLANNWYFPGAVVRVPVARNGVVHRIDVIAQHRPVPWQVWFGIASEFWTLIFVTVISARRADHPEARILALQLLTLAFGIVLARNNWLTPWPLLDAVVAVTSTLLIPLSTALLATYAMRFALPASALRRSLEWSSYLAAFASATFGIAEIFGTWTGAFVVDGSPFTDETVQSAIRILSDLLPVACVFLAIRASRGAERTRIAWSAGSLSILYLSHIVAAVLYLIDPANGTLGNIILNVSAFAAPIGLTYSLLSRRLLDVGFALNRAAMFATTTLLLAGLFAGLQWIADQTLLSYVHVTSAGVQLSIAVVVYYVVRLSRDRTDALVSSLFFAKRQRRLAALTELADAVDEVEDPQEIAPIVVEFLRERASIDAIVFLQSATNDFAAAPGSPEGTATIGKDDLVAVMLRTRRSPTRITSGSAPGGIAFPMLIRRHVRGVLVCAPPQDDNEFAPDEMQALFLLAARMASARDDLLSQSLREQLQAIEARATGGESRADHAFMLDEWDETRREPASAALSSADQSGARPPSR